MTTAMILLVILENEPGNDLRSDIPPLNEQVQKYPILQKYLMSN